jgi:hypothetical protein
VRAVVFSLQIRKVRPMTTGTDIGSQLPVGNSPSETQAREDLIFSFIKNKQLPARTNFINDPNAPGSATSTQASWRKLTTTQKDANGANRKLTLYVLPRYFEIGSDDDPLFIPMWPATMQKVADLYYAVFPSRKIVDIIWQNADTQLPIGPPPGFTIPGPDMEKTPSWMAYNKILQTQMKGLGQNILMAGGKKDVVSGPGLDGSKVAIYSTPFGGSGHPLRDLGEWVDNPWQPGTKMQLPLHQPYSTIHASSYSDYSHGIRLVSKVAMVDDIVYPDVTEIFLDPVLNPLVSDQGIFVPRFPNVSPGSVAKFSTTDSASDNSVAVDPSVPVQMPTAILPSFLGIPPSKQKRVLLMGAAGIGVSMIAGFSWPLTVGAAILGGFVGDKTGQ